MKRYLLFCYDVSSINGGWKNYSGSFDTIEEAKAAATQGGKRHIVDTETEKIIAETGGFQRQVGSQDPWRYLT